MTASVGNKTSNNRIHRLINYERLLSRVGFFWLLEWIRHKGIAHAVWRIRWRFSSDERNGDAEDVNVIIWSVWERGLNGSECGEWVSSKTHNVAAFPVGHYSKSRWMHSIKANFPASGTLWTIKLMNLSVFTQEIRRDSFGDPPKYHPMQNTQQTHRVIWSNIQAVASFMCHSMFVCRIRWSVSESIKNDAAACNRMTNENVNNRLVLSLRTVVRRGESVCFTWAPKTVWRLTDLSQLGFIAFDFDRMVFYIKTGIPRVGWTAFFVCKQSPSFDSFEVACAHSTGGCISLANHHDQQTLFETFYFQCRTKHTVLQRWVSNRPKVHRIIKRHQFVSQRT